MSIFISEEQKQDPTDQAPNDAWTEGVDEFRKHIARGGKPLGPAAMLWTIFAEPLEEERRLIAERTIINNRLGKKISARLKTIFPTPAPEPTPLYGSSDTE